MSKLEQGKYFATAVALKTASQWPSMYRRLGNRFGASQRAKRVLPASAGSRAAEIVRFYEEYIEPNTDGRVRVLEVGTGWMHFEAIVLRALFPIQASLTDVWDNRQLVALQARVEDIVAALDEEIALTPSQTASAGALVAATMESTSFDDLYDRLGFDYTVDPTGLFSRFDANTFDVSCSYNVLEHVKRDDVPAFLQDMRRVMKPGGRISHNIDISDHLVSFGGVHLSRKEYLRHSNRAWRVCLENDVQYINRMQRSEWLEAFDSAGFELLHEQSDQLEHPTPDIHSDHAGLSEGDRSCVRVQVIAEKPTKS